MQQVKTSKQKKNKKESELSRKYSFAFIAEI